MRRSRILEKLRNGKVALVTNPSFTYSWRVVEMVGYLGFDDDWIDMEHRDFTYKDAAVNILAARAQDMDGMVRMRKDSYADYFRPLEDGAAGIMVPHIKTREDAEFAVYNAKYTPIGRRGMDGVGADTMYGLEGFDTQECNRETFIIGQIEDYEPLEIIEDIVSVPGLDGLFVGPGDLSQSYGNPMALDDPRVEAGIAKVAATCAQAGLWWGTPARDVTHARRFIDMGCRFLATGSDYGILSKGFQELKDEYAALLRDCDM